MEEKVQNETKTYISIDLKSFYASVECQERGLDPLRTNLVVADEARTSKTICLAVSPSLKAYGISGRARLFEVVERVKQINLARQRALPDHAFSGKSCDAEELKRDPSLEVGYIAAMPQMSLYMKYSNQIVDIYLRYVSFEDMHIYSIDEVFIDATAYLRAYHLTARELAKRMVRDVENEVGITATAGIGTNLYLCKIAMDIGAKHIPPDRDGVRIAELNEQSYRRLLWSHRPITDFWRIGGGYAKKLAEKGMYTMGDVARCSLGGENDYYNEELLYKMFGVNAELLIDHAWGYEPCTIADIKNYKPQNNSISSGQVLQHPYDFDKGRLIVHEMTDLLVLDLVEKGLVCDQIVLTVGYDIDNMKNPEIRKQYHGELTTDHYGRTIPKAAHGSVNLGRQTSSTRLIIDATLRLYDEIVDKNLLVRRMYVVANHVIPYSERKQKEAYEQMDLFTDYAKQESEEKQEEQALEREHRMQQAIISIKKKYGKNALLKGMNLEEGAMTIERNNQVGGHRA